MKPQNVLLDGFGQAKLADFGIAGAAATVDAWTPGYAAPEQVAGHAEPRSDLFALGMTLAACALGRRPFGTGAAAMAAVEAIESHLTALHAELERALPGLGTILVTCLRHTPADRFPSASALAHALQGLRGSYASGPVLRRLVVLARPELATVSEPEPRNDETTLAVVRGNLRPRRDAFVGRADEVAELRRRLHRGERLVTLLGPGGAGKTSLATQVAHLEQDRLEGGAWFVDLSEATDPDGVRAAVSRAFDLELDPNEPRQLEAVLRGRGRALLVLDNLLMSLEERCADPEPRVRALAVQRLVRHLSASPDVDGQRLVDLAAWIDDRALQVELAERAGPAGVPLLRTLLSDGNRQVRRRAALTLAARLPEAPEPDLEAALVDLLPSGDVEVCLKVARWGTVAAVPALLALEKTSRDRTVREAARAAVTQLQRAVGTQARGGLTIAADGSGQLSTAAPAGDLSLDARVSPGPTRARP